MLLIRLVRFDILLLHKLFVLFFDIPYFHRHQQIRQIVASSVMSYEHKAAGPTLDELNNPQAVSNEGYLSIIIDFSKKVEMLRNIANSEEYRKRYAKDFNGECFYWIPVDRLP